MDVIGKTFGKLTVIGPGERKGYVLCRCECGVTKEIRATNLTKKTKPTQSCGCVQRKIASDVGSATLSENARDLRESNSHWKTNFSSISRKKPPKNNTSGAKGVAWNLEKERWEAYIGVHGKRIRLGYFSRKEDAEEARKNAERRYHIPLIEARKQFKEDKTHEEI